MKASSIDCRHDSVHRPAVSCIDRSGRGNDDDRPRRPAGIKISPTLYGIFFEEINRAGEGGLYAEMLQNRSFEDDRGDRDQKPTKIPGWRLVESPGAKATISLDNSEPLNPHNPTRCGWRLPTSANSRRAWPTVGSMASHWSRGPRMIFRSMPDAARTCSGPLVATLEDRSGILSEAKLIRKIGQQWKQYRCTLTAKETTASGRLVLASIFAGHVLARPGFALPQNTLKGRPNGLRPDLAEMLADLKPSFNRFPGGCYVEGNRLHNAFRWKNSIGDLAQRPGHWNLWGYRRPTAWAITSICNFAKTSARSRCS